MFQGSTESSYSYYDIFIAPFVAGMDVIIPSCLMWFVVQYLATVIMPYISPNFKRLSVEDQRNFAIRIVSIVNGLVMFNSAFFFVDQLRQNGWALHSRHYEEIEGYRPYRLIIVGYFLWDILVCVYYRWGLMWTVHAIASFLGTYFLAFPFSEQYATYYSGMFETSNAFLHLSVLLKMLGVHLQLAAVLEYVFALLFFLIRVVGGTYVTASWYMEMVPRLWRGQGHSHATIASCLLLVAVVMLLQYFWFWEIVKIALGLGGGNAKQQQEQDATSKKGGDSKKKPSSIDETNAQTKKAEPTPSSPNRKRRAAEKVE